MNPFREYSLQSIFACLQAALILAGSMTTATLLKAFGYPEARAEWRWWPVFVRNWGALLMLIPIVWVVATLGLERHQSSWFSKRWTVGSGILLLLFLGLILFWAAMGSVGGTLIQINGE